MRRDLARGPDDELGRERQPWRADRRRLEIESGQYRHRQSGVGDRTREDADVIERPRERDDALHRHQAVRTLESNDTAVGGGP